MSYIQTAKARLKAITVETLISLQAEGKKKVRLQLESDAAANFLGKDPATATVPIYWLICAKEKVEDARTPAEAEHAFDDFISDWISGWGLTNKYRSKS